MKKIRLVILMIGILIITGCSKLEGTWCTYTETYSSLVLTDNSITSEQLDNIKKVVANLEYLKSFDVVDDLESGNPVINIYFNVKEGMDNSEALLNNLKGVKRVEKKSFEIPKEKLIIDKNSYVYGTNLDNVDAFLNEGEAILNKDEVYLKEDDLTFYYRDNLLCKDLECNNTFQKSRNKDCK